MRMKRDSRNTLRLFLHQAGLFALLGLVLVCLHSSAWALDTVVWKPMPDAPERTSVGKTLAVTQDKGVLLLERSGEIQAIEPQMIVKATRNSQEFQPFTQDEMAKEFLQRLPQGFQVLKTDHYTIFYETTPEYARWCGTLLERLYDSFSQFSTKQELKLPEPEFPLVVVMFANVKNYRAFLREELSSFDSSVIGYYSFQTNRMVCYDLSGEETYTEHRPSATKSKIHRQILKRPEALKQVATLIHEATHQLAYNRGALRGHTALVQRGAGAVLRDAGRPQQGRLEIRGQDQPPANRHGAQGAAKLAKRHVGGVDYKRCASARVRHCRAVLRQRVGTNVVSNQNPPGPVRAVHPNDQSEKAAVLGQARRPAQGL